MGIEAYGLVGFFAAIQFIPFLLDMGLSTTLNRELAKLSAHKNSIQDMRNIVYTFQFINWGITVVLGLILFFLAPLIAKHWFKSEQLTTETIKQSIMIISMVLALQLTGTFYHDGLNGLQKQILTNKIILAVSTFRNLGIFFVLWKISPTVQAYFIWQFISSFLFVFLMSIFLWKNLPKTHKTLQFNFHILKTNWKFASGVSSIRIIDSIFLQSDRIFLSKLLPLESFGFYSLAKNVTVGLQRIIEPVAASIYPAFCQLASINEKKN